MTPSRVQPALFGGLAIGVLTVLPVVNLVNLCCCAWVVSGGLLAAYLLQQNSPTPILSGDGAIVGLMAGAFGAIIGTVLSIPLAMALGPMQLDIFDRVLQSSRDMPPEVRGILEQWRNGMVGGAVMGIGFGITLLFSLCFYSIFGLLGGLIGAAIFKEHASPPPPPPPTGFTPPTFTPPTNLPPPPPVS